METVVTQHCTGPNKLATHLGVPLKGTLKGQSPAIIIFNSVKLYNRKYPASWEKYHLLPMPLQEQGSERGGNVPEIKCRGDFFTIHPLQIRVRLEMGDGGRMGTDFKRRV